MTRFFKETAEDLKRNPSAVAPGFHVKAEASKASSAGTGCLKCGDTASHRSDQCQKIGTMSKADWRALAGDLCIRCGLHDYVKGQRCSYRCSKCGDNHMSCRHGQVANQRKREGSQKTGPGQKRARRDGPPQPPTAPGAYHSNAYPPPPPQYGPPPPQYGPPPPGYHYQPSREAPPPPHGPPAGPSHQGPPPPAGMHPDSWRAGREAERAAQKKRAAKKKGKKAIKQEKPEKAGQ